MDVPLHVYLDGRSLDEARAGQHNFLNRVATALRPFGYRLDFRPDDLAERAKALGSQDWALHHMSEGAGQNGLTFRKVYLGSFWQIDRSAERWNWHTATSPYSPSDVDPSEARRFTDLWRDRLYPGGIPPISAQGFVLVPLQGKLVEKRHFQAFSPIDMLRETIIRLSGTPVVATLHPRETYDEQECAALRGLTDQFPALTISDEPSASLLPRCDAVVTQNSGTALAGYFLQKPAVLFAQSDFHHIALSIPRLGIDNAFAALPRHRPDFDSYLWWFLQHMSLNAGREDVGPKIIATLRRCGMPL